MKPGQQEKGTQNEMALTEKIPGPWPFRHGADTSQVLVSPQFSSTSPDTLAAESCCWVYWSANINRIHSGMNQTLRLF